MALKLNQLGGELLGHTSVEKESTLWNLGIGAALPIREVIGKLDAIPIPTLAHWQLNQINADLVPSIEHWKWVQCWGRLVKFVLSVLTNLTLFNLQNMKKEDIVTQIQHP